MTADHLVVLHRLADELIINYDSDTAGADAAERAIDLAQAADFSVKIATVEGFKDAADAAKADPKNVERTIAAAIPAPEFYFGNIFRRMAGLACHARRFAESAGSTSKVAFDGESRGAEFWIKKLSERTGIADRTLEEESKRAEAKGPFDCLLQSRTGGGAEAADAARRTALRGVARDRSLAERFFIVR